MTEDRQQPITSGRQEDLVTQMRRFRNTCGLVLALVLLNGGTLWGAGPFAKNVPNGKAGSPGRVPSLDSSDYEFVTLQIDGAVQSRAFDVNNRRMVSGDFMDVQGLIRSFIWQGGRVLEVVQCEGAPITSLGTITESGTLFGNWGTDAYQQVGTWDPNSRRCSALPPLSYGSSTYPIMIGNRMADTGAAVGIACLGTFSAPTDCVGWVWDGKAYTTLSVPAGLPSGAYAAPYAINNRGQVSGQYELFIPNVGPIPLGGFIIFRGSTSEIALSGPNGPVPTAGLDLADSGEILAASFLFNPADQSALIDKGRTLLLPSFPTPGVTTIYMGMNARRDLAGFRIGLPPTYLSQAIAVFRLRP
jgi:hypothetical protein